MITPLFKLIVVLPTEHEENTSGLIRPDNILDKKRFGIIVAKGTDADVNINVGDKVLWFGDVGEHFEEDGYEYIVMHDHDLKAILK